MAITSIWGCRKVRWLKNAMHLFIFERNFTTSTFLGFGECLFGQKWRGEIDGRAGHDSNCGRIGDPLYGQMLLESPIEQNQANYARTRQQ